ncbi:MAG: metalloregulator ArsR/SmtB family transcription factor [Lachnospiraceae bacterium]
MKEPVKEVIVEQCEYIHVHEDIVTEVNEKMPSEEELYDLADFFKIFGDSTRLKILTVLLCSEMCVCDLAQILGMTQSAISHQLRTLKQMALVKNRRDGKTILYSLTDGHIMTILNQGLEHIEEDK